MWRSTAAHAQHLQQKDFAHELPKVDFQDQFVAINVDKVSPIVFRKENQRFQASGKKKAAAKVLLTMVPNVRMLFYA